MVYVKTGFYTVESSVPSLSKSQDHVSTSPVDPFEKVTTEGATPVTQPLIEPLSERELTVLRLLGTELSGPEIARELMVSLATIRTHTQNIYGKLGVNNRRAAVRRAEEFDLL